MRKPFEVKEFDSIICNEDYKEDEKYKYLNQKDFNNLIAFIHEFNGDMDSADSLDFMKLGYQRNIGDIISIRNYVGLIQMKNGFQLQVLPKIAFSGNDEENAKTKKIFLKMLCAMKEFPGKVFNEAALNVDKMNLYELFINMYLQEVRQLVKRGIKSEYIEQTDQNWTMGRLVGNEYVSLNLTGRSWEEDTLELALIPGTYRIITTNRLPNGNQFAWEKTFVIKEGEKLEETLRLREAQLGDMLERISLPEFEVKDSAGNTVTCADLTKGGKKILMWLEESREPTEHILNEMLEHAEKFHEFEKSVSFLIRTQEAKLDPLLAKVLKTFPDVSIYYDSFEENIELLGRRMYVDPDKLPLILVTNGESVGIYATSGYNVGTGDMLIRIMEEVPEA